MDLAELEKTVEVTDRTGVRLVSKQSSFMGMMSQCSQMHEVFSVLQRVAATSSTVLVLGESGTGKELVARAIHKLSGRSGKLVPVNCGAIPEDILESELFGHERGAFTGAVASKIGRFQLADGGTIFLDEIGEMSPKLQVKLLRVLQERRIDPVGSTRSVDVNVRVIAATHRDLREEVRQGRFREDLFYRLHVVPVNLPPLRQRGSDPVMLVQTFLDAMCRTASRDLKVLSDCAKDALLRYDWPGNVRELQNLVERISVMHEGRVVSAHDLPEYIVGAPSPITVATPALESGCDFTLPDGGVDFNQMIEDLETSLITAALERTDGNKKAAADLLRLNRTTLVEKIRKKGLDSAIPRRMFDRGSSALPGGQGEEAELG